VNKRAAAGAITLGAVSIIGQIVLMREIMVLFYGNELSAGVCLLVWLTWTGTGGYLGTFFVKKFDFLPRIVAALLLAYALLLPATVALARVAKGLVGISQGEIIGIGPMILIAGGVLFPFSILSGCLFPVLIRAAGVHPQKKGPEDRPGRVYLMESIGSSVGGIVASLILIRYLDALTVSWIAALLASAAASLLAWVDRRRVILTLSAAASLLFIVQIFFPIPDVGAITRRAQWKEFSLVESVDSIYGNITVTRQGSQTTFFDNGVLLFSSPDLMTVEERVIYPMLSHPRPERVLLVGGGVSSTLAQILKHPSVVRVDYVELDPTLIELARRHLPPEVTRPLRDKRVRVIHADGRLFVKTTDERYDVVIVNTGDPVSARVNRYFTREFFGEVRRILKTDGVFAVSAGSSEEIISPALASFLRSVALTLRTAFPYTAVIPGPTAYFLASRDEDRIVTDPMLLAARMKERAIVNIYVTEYFLPFRLDKERLRYINDSIAAASGDRINTDLSPISYLYDMILWSFSLRPGTKILLGKLSGLKPAWAGAALVLVTLLFIGVLVLASDKKRPLPFLTLAPAALAAGFSEIALEVVILVAFQSFYGYVYFGLGLIVSSFMIGLAAGTAAAKRLIGGTARPWRALVVIQLAYAGFCLVTIAILYVFSGHVAGGWFSRLDLVFSFLNAICGTICGFHFIAASRALSVARMSAESAGGVVYGTNLIGAGAGALFASVVMIPIFGLVATAALVCALDVCAAAAVGFGATRIR
jgi:spermidine synthase